MLYKLNKSVTNRRLLMCLSKHYFNKNINSRKMSSNKIIKSKSNVQRFRPKTQNNDYLGIFETQKEEISGLYDTRVDKTDALDKYKDLSNQSTRLAQMNEQNLLVTSFGKVRLDSDNTPLMHGHYESYNTRLKFDIKEFEQQLNESNRQNVDSNQNLSESEANVIEKQYFDYSETKSPKANSNSIEDNSEFEFIDSQYFSASFKPLVKHKIDFKFHSQFKTLLTNENDLSNSFIKEQQKTNLESKELNNSFDSKTVSFESPLKSDLFSLNFKSNINSNTKPNEEIDENDIQSKINEQMNIKLEEVKTKSDDLRPKPPRTGAQYLEDIRSGKESAKYLKKDNTLEKTLGGERLDSKGYRILSGQVLNFTSMTREDISELLFKSILFNDADIVAINKPYGMSIHSKDTNSGPVLTDYLPKLTEMIDCNHLYTVHRLDRDTTGVLLLAKTQEKANFLNKLFLEHKVSKRYICITRGVPDQLEGIIDIPIEMGKCDGKERMVLRPQALEEYRNVIKSSKSAKRAVTQYKVLTQSQNAALIEVWPQTGVRHQIRVHLGLALRCPILGDHKYSHLDRIAPQKLTGDMLLALKVRQSKVRYIPMHLHAKQYCLSGAGAEGRNIFINAPLPHHFHKNMSGLKLRE